MKRYLKNKKYIPYSFYEKKQQINKKDEKVILTLFVILNLLLFPMNLSKIHELNNKKMESFKEKSYSDIKQISIKKVSNLIDSVDRFEVEEAEISDEGGKIRINSLDNLKRIEEDKNITVCDTTLYDKKSNEYEVSLKVNE